MTDSGATITRKCEYCEHDFEIPTHDSRGRKRSEGQIEQVKFCSPEHRRLHGMAVGTVRRRIKAGADPLVDGRTTRGLADFTVKQLDAVREFISPDMPLSVRTCCYHLLSLGLLESTENFSTMIQKITQARLRDEDDPNYLNDDCFVDRSRVIHHSAGFSDVNAFVDVVRGAYSRNPWQDQPVVPIILCEKIGHGEFLKPLCDAAHVRLCLSKGFHGRSFLASKGGVAEHCAAVINNRQTVALGYMGDFDCSGLQLEKVAQFGNDKEGTAHREGLRQILERKHGITDGLTWERLALTEGQFRALPQNALVKVKDEWTDEDGVEHKGDSNAKAYIERYGEYGGEIEALGVEQMQGLVEDFIAANRVESRWEQSLVLEAVEVEKLAGLQL